MSVHRGPLAQTELSKRQLFAEPNPDEFNFQLPAAGIHPAQFVEQHFGKNAPEAMRFHHGTTTLGFIYKGTKPDEPGGIVIATDSRATGGSFIASKNVNKILDVTDNIVATMAGGAADCQFWTRFLSKYCSLYELREKEPISVAAASKYLANVLYNYRGMGLSLGTMVAGYDKFGPSIYMVDSDGTRVKGNLFSVGSGSLFALGILDNFYKESMSHEEALDLGRKAIMHATYRDSGSGGQCNVVHLTQDKKKRFPLMDVSDMYYEFSAQMKRDDVDPGFD